MKEINYALNELYNIQTRLEMEMPEKEALFDIEKEINYDVAILSANKKIGDIIRIYPRLMKTIAELSSDRRDYDTAMHFRRNKIIFQERSFEKCKTDFAKMVVLHDLGNDYMSFRKYMYRKGMDSISATLLSYVTLEDAVELRKVTPLKGSNPRKERMYNNLPKNFEFSIYIILKDYNIDGQKDFFLISEDKKPEQELLSDLEFIIGDYPEIIKKRKCQVMKLNAKDIIKKPNL